MTRNIILVELVISFNFKCINAFC